MFLLYNFNEYNIDIFCKNLKSLGENFLYKCTNVEYFLSDCENLKTIYDNFLYKCSSLESIGNNSLFNYNNNNLKSIGNNFLYECEDSLKSNIIINNNINYNN